MELTTSSPSRFFTCMCMAGLKPICFLETWWPSECDWLPFQPKSWPTMVTWLTLHQLRKRSRVRLTLPPASRTNSRPCMT